MNSHRADRSSRCNHAELRHAPKNTSDPYTSRSLVRSLARSFARSPLAPFFGSRSRALPPSPLPVRRSLLSYTDSTSSLTLTHPFPAWAALRPLVLAPYSLVISAGESDYSKLSRSTGFTVSILSRHCETWRCLARCGYYRRSVGVPSAISRRLVHLRRVFVGDNREFRGAP